MSVARWFEASSGVPGAPGVRALSVSGDQWRSAAEGFASAGGRLLALWADRTPAADLTVYAAFAASPGVLVLDLRADEDAVASDAAADAEARYSGLEYSFPAAIRMQRAIADQYGVRSTCADRRPWQKHSEGSAGYPFVRVEGEGVHEIPVGPVHAGIIEPGHFRFSVVGEKVLRLEQRLGYTHKGIEQRFTELSVDEAQRLAARVSADTAVGFSWAYAQALEGLARAEVPPRAAYLRALCLELERVQNHLGDLGALGNDAGFAFGLAQFSRLKEYLLRATETAFGQRYLLDAIVPGGMARDLAKEGAAALEQCIEMLDREVALLRGIYDEHSGLRGRFVGAGLVAPALAARLGLTGLAGRASGQDYDLRVDLPCPPFGELGPKKCGLSGGDVAARVAIRFDEVFESCRLMRRILDDLPPGPHRVAVPPPPAHELGVGLIEAWRGPVLVALTVGRNGRIHRCHPHDPSWQNWPVLEHAIIDNIVPDFPLINKSFNLSYSGHDL